VFYFCLENSNSKKSLWLCTIHFFANNVNTGKEKRSDYTPDSDVFVESPVHESTTFNQTIKQ
jgi:hypothetical protein